MTLANTNKQDAIATAVNLGRDLDIVDKLDYDKAILEYSKQKALLKKGKSMVKDD